jgi:hypothetical protein
MFCFTVCSTDLSGGAFYSDSRIVISIIIKGCNFTDCKAESNGGGLAPFSPRYVLVDECIFLNCNAGDNGMSNMLFEYIFFCFFFFFFFFYFCLFLKYLST